MKNRYDTEHGKIYTLKKISFALTPLPPHQVVHFNCVSPINDVDNDLRRIKIIEVKPLLKISWECIKALIESNLE